MRALTAGLAVLGVALIATTATALAGDNHEDVRVVSMDASQTLAPSVVVAVDGISTATVLPPAAFTALDDNGTRPIGVEHLGLGRLDVALMVDTAADVSVETLAKQQATTVELLRHLQGAGQLGVYTSTAQVLRAATPDPAADFSYLAGLRPEGDRQIAAGLLGALEQFQRDPATRRALIVMSTGSDVWSSLPDAAGLATVIADRDVQVIWLVLEGAPPSIVDDLTPTGRSPILVEGAAAAAAVADHLATALQAQYRVTIDMTGAVGPVRLRVEASSAAHEVSLAVAGGFARIPPVTAPVATDPDIVRPLPAATRSVAPAPPSATRSPAAQPAAAPEARPLGVSIELGGRSTTATWWVLAIFAVVAGATTLTVVASSGSATVAPAGRPHHIGSSTAHSQNSQREKSDMDKLVVVGQGYVGLPLAVRAAEVGFQVVGFDMDEFRVKLLASGESFVADVSNARLDAVLASGVYSVTDEPRRCAGFDYAVISVPTPLKDGVPDLSYIEDASTQLARYVRPGSTVVLESSTYPGTTEEVVGPILEDGSGLTAGEDFFLGYSPERVDPGNCTWTLVNTPKIVSGINPASLTHIDRFYRRLVERTVPVSRPAEAELAKLLENTFRHVNIALVNETAMFAHELGIDIWDALDAAATKPFGYMRFNPGPGVGGHCLPVDPSYLSWRCRYALGRPSRFIELANDINTGMPTYVVNRLVLALNERSLCVKGRDILLLGLSYKKNTGDARESPARTIASQLVSLGANVSAADPCLLEADVPAGVHLVDLTETELAKADAVVLLVDHDQFDLGAVADHGLVLDCRRVLSGPNVEVL